MNGKGSVQRDQRGTGRLEGGRQYLWREAGGLEEDWLVGKGTLEKQEEMVRQIVRQDED